VFSRTVIANAGERFSDFAPYVAAVNDEDTVAFQAALRGGATGVFTGDGGAIAEFAGPTLLAGVTSHPDLNNAGAMSFYGEDDGAQGVFLLRDGRLRAILEALVLSALAARSAEAVVVINAEQSISFYSAAAARLLRLPLPAEPMTLAEMRLQHPLFDTESVTSPLAAAISEHRAAEGELSEVLPDGALRTYWVKAVPFFDAGRYLGAATYMTVIAERPSV
jgi:PAS domain-containing protein